MVARRRLGILARQLAAGGAAGGGLERRVDEVLDTPGDGPHPLWAELDCGAIRHNVDASRRAAGDGVTLIASIKGNGYGHGAVPVAMALADAGVDWLWTGSFEDAIAIRAAGVESRIVMFAASPAGMPALVAHGLTPTVHNEETAAAAASAANASPDGVVGVFVKVDAGLGRLGVPLDGAVAFILRAAALPGVRVDGIYSHVSWPPTATLRARHCLSVRGP